MCLAHPLSKLKSGAVESHRILWCSEEPGVIKHATRNVPYFHHICTSVYHLTEQTRITTAECKAKYYSQFPERK